MLECLSSKANAQMEVIPARHSPTPGLLADKLRGSSNITRVRTYYYTSCQQCPASRDTVGW